MKRFQSLKVCLLYRVFRLGTAAQDGCSSAIKVVNVRQRLGFEVRRTSQKEFAAFVTDQMARWKEAVQLSGARID